jgi:hypothetical protein
MTALISATRLVVRLRRPTVPLLRRARSATPRSPPASFCRAADKARGLDLSSRLEPLRPPCHCRLSSRPPCAQATPRERLVRGNAMPASGQAHRHARLEGLLDHPNLLRCRPAPAALNQGDNLDAIRRVGLGTVVSLTLVEWKTMSVRRPSQ